MARKARQRISYVLPLANQATGHRLGVNGIAVDEDRSLLYSGGRDGVVCTWNLDLDLSASSDSDELGTLSSRHNSNGTHSGRSSYSDQVQAHTHWINDLVLADGNRAVVSASSDVSVKVWRPDAEDHARPQTVGLHSDYVKCLASPSSDCSWVASGGLDRKICLWDLAGGGQQLQIKTDDEEADAKGSVYALAARRSLLASGGPESTVKLWDPRTAKRITKFVGHTDNIRSILINEDGDTIITASSDQTVKVWSMAAGRCMYTLTMHNDSVWALQSRHPHLSVFYSGDKYGLVVKTDTRGVGEIDEGLSVAVCKEQQGVSKLAVAGSYIWTATSSPNINRWANVDTHLGIDMPESVKSNRWSGVSRLRSSTGQSSLRPPDDHTAKGQIPLGCVLRMSNTAVFPPYIPRDREMSPALAPPAMVRTSSVAFETEPTAVTPFRMSPEESIEGQNGLTRHIILNDKRRVLTVDTAGEIVLWDIVKCVPVKSFGKQDLDAVVNEVNTAESVLHWCSVDTRTGSLTFVLDQNHCFDAEVYADELEEAGSITFKEDQRINIGKWVLRYLFAGLIDEEIRRDALYRHDLFNGVHSDVQNCSVNGTEKNGESNDVLHDLTQVSTPRPGSRPPPLITPGLAIGVATPLVPLNPSGTQAPTALEDTSDAQGTTAQQDKSKSSWERAGDYFSSKTSSKSQVSPSDGGEDGPPMSPTEDSPAKDSSSSSFSKRLRIPFTAKKSGKTQPTEVSKQVIAEEKADDSDSKSSKVEETIFDESFEGTVQRMRHTYAEELKTTGKLPPSGITPSLPNETPVLKPPPATRIVIQEDRPDSGEVADLFEGTVGSVQGQADLIEKVAPVWLADVLLRNKHPQKEVVKISFLLEPYEDILPPLASTAGENDRLNANRMLRARKVLAYIAERLKVEPGQEDAGTLKPEECLELYCLNQLIPPLMTLATIRSNIWRSSNDVVLHYRPSGRRKFILAPPKAAAAQPKAEASPKGPGTASKAVAGSA